MEYLKKHARPAGSDRGMDLAGKALTPKSERPRSTWGSLIQAYGFEGQCDLDRKCMKQAGHLLGCYPTTQAKGG